MNKIILPLIFLTLFSCLDETIQNDCFPTVSLTGTVFLSNPEFINLQVPGGYTETTIQTRDLIIINSTSSGYKAFDLECPESDCSSNLEFDGLKLICQCSDKEYNSLNGSPIDGEGCFLLEYTVLASSSTLQISR